MNNARFFSCILNQFFKQLEIAADLQEYAIFSVCIAIFIIGFTSVCVSIIYLLRNILGVCRE